MEFTVTLQRKEVEGNSSNLARSSKKTKQRGDKKVGGGRLMSLFYTQAKK